MRKSHVYLCIAVASATLWMPAAELERQGADVEEDRARPVRPGGVDGRPWWNEQGVMFLYPPSFGFKPVAGAVKYRYVAEASDCQTYAFSAMTPNETLAPIWASLPVGFVWLQVLGVTEEGRVLGVAGMRRFWRSAPFARDVCPKPVCGYGEAARAYYDWLFGMTNTQMLVKSAEPDEHYLYNTYPAKTESAIVKAMIRYAELRPDRRDKALAAARHAAEFLLGHSNPPGTALEYFPHTYRVLKPASSREGVTSEEYAGQNMLVYPASAGSAYLALYRVLGDKKYLWAAERIAATYRRLQGADGTWYLKLWERDGSPVNENRLLPFGVCDFLEELYAVTKDWTWRTMSDRAFGFVEKGPLATWNWEGQFEDVKPSKPYRNLTIHPPCSAALHLLRRYPGDAAKRELARECLRFAEDQFVAWRPPFDETGRGPTVRDTTVFPCTAKDSWYDVPGALEQYDWYLPIDSSAAKIGSVYLAFYRAEGREIDLDKAKALGNAVTRMQKLAGNGAIPTHWVPWDVRSDEKHWINCGIGTAVFLERLEDLMKRRITSRPESRPSASRM